MRKHEMNDGESEACRVGDLRMITSKSDGLYNVTVDFGVCSAGAVNPNRIWAMGSALYRATRMYDNYINAPDYKEDE